MAIETKIDRYREVLDEIDALKQRHKDELRDITIEKDILIGDLRDWMKDQGTNQVATDRMTVMLKEKTYVNVADWPAFYDFVQKENDLEFLAKKAKSTEILQYIEEFGEVPPGIELTKELTINHRRKG